MTKFPAYALLALAGCTSSASVPAGAACGCGDDFCIGEADAATNFETACTDEGYLPGFVARVDGGYELCCQGESP